MECITRKEMKFGDIIVPARTKCTVINKINSTTVDAPGVQVNLAISFWEIKRNQKCLVSELEIKDSLDNSYNGSEFTGITVHTNTSYVFMDAGNHLYWQEGLYNWQLEKIFKGKDVPKSLLKEKYSFFGKDSKLEDVIEYLEDEFNEWIHNNCEFVELTEEEIENGEGFDGAQAGDRTLSDSGLEKFYIKKLEYQNKLETTGFTYDFKGGLIWD